MGEINGRPGGWKKRWPAVFRGAAPGDEVGQVLFGSGGAAAVELALMLPFLVFMLITVVELGRLAYFSIEVSNAAHAGAQYGAQSEVTAASNAGMVQAALNDGYNVTGLTATAGYFCECSTGTSVVSCVLASCSGSRLIEYVQVNTSATVKPLVQYPGIPASYNLSGSAIMRVAQ